MTSAILAGRATGFDTNRPGPPVVLLHALPFAPEMWRPQADALADLARVIAPAAPGFGGAPLPPGGWTVDGHADELAAALGAAGVGPIVLGGLSMGGYVALAFARRHPAKLRGLILADTKAEADKAEARATRDKMAAFAREHGSAAVIDTMLPKMLSEQTRNERPEVVAEVKRIAAAQPPEAIAAAQIALRDRPDATAGLRAVRVPTLVVVGADDAITPPSAAQAMVRAIPGGTLVELPGAGHLSNLETPAEFTAAVRSFLRMIG